MSPTAGVLRYPTGAARHTAAAPTAHSGLAVT